MQMTLVECNVEVWNWIRKHLQEKSSCY